MLRLGLEGLKLGLKWLSLSLPLKHSKLSLLARLTKWSIAPVATFLFLFLASTSYLKWLINWRSNTNSGLRKFLRCRARLKEVPLSPLCPLCYFIFANHWLRLSLLPGFDGRSNSRSQGLGLRQVRSPRRGRKGHRGSRRGPHSGQFSTAGRSLNFATHFVSYLE